jgi:hypothetical protein
LQSVDLSAYQSCQPLPESESLAALQEVLHRLQPPSSADHPSECGRYTPSGVAQVGALDAHPPWVLIGIALLKPGRGVLRPFLVPAQAGHPDHSRAGLGLAGCLDAVVIVACYPGYSG